MSRYNQYGNYYDPVGSHSNQPSGYTYRQQSTTSASDYPSTATSYQNYGSSTYGGQQYGQQANHSTTHAAAALSSLSSQDKYNQLGSANRTSSSGQYDNISWHDRSSTSDSYGNNSNSALPNHSQSNNSPLYANTQQSASFGRLSGPAQTQSSSNTFGTSSSYQNAPSSAGTSNRSHPSPNSPAAQNQPPRYNSPLHAIHGQQQGHTKQSSHGPNPQPSPQMAQGVHSGQQTANRQQSASVEPSPTTVDPSQVYDNRAELQRKAQIEAEKRRRYEAEHVAKRAEEERVEAENRKVEEEKQKAEKEAELKKVEQARKSEERRKAREEKRQSNSAATALQQMASMGGGDSSTPPANVEEVEMRAMFQKMREFNAKNPAMLAKLWEEERKQHASASSPPAAAARRKPSAASPTTAAADSAFSPQPQGGMRPFKRPTPPPKAAKGAAAATQRAAQPIPQQQPIQVHTTTSLWPPHKKGALAEATSNWLMSLPANAGKAVNADVIKQVLNSNPSYVQLCESLEGLGLKFERSNLARELLKAVPDGLKAQPVPKPAAIPLGAVIGTAAQANGSAKDSPDTPKKKGRPKKSNVERAMGEAITPSASSTVNYESPLSLSDTAREVNSMDRPAFQTTSVYGGIRQNAQQSPYFTQPQTATNGSRPPSSPRPPEIKPKTEPEEPPRPPADKEEAARKRTFGDLVDLTAEDSDDEGPPKKIVQPPSGPTIGVNTQQRDPLPDLQHQTYNQFKHAANLNPAHNVPGRNVLQPMGPPPSQMTLPSTVPPGPHQIPQQAAAIPQPPPKPTGPPPEQLQQSRIRGKMLVEPIMRDRVARKSKYDSRTIARDVLLATGRHPDMRALNGHMGTMQKLLGTHGGEIDSGGQGNKSDLSTIRWDIIDPGTPKDAPAKSVEDGSKGDDERKSAAPQPSEPLQQGLPRFNHPSRSAKQQQPKRRGRPPRHSIPDSSATLTNGLGDTSRSTPRRLSTPTTPSATTTIAADKMAASGTNVGYAAFRQMDPEGNVVKKKGRPIGWRKNVHSREAQGLEPKSHPSRPLPSRLRQEQKAASQEQQVVEPRYSVYKCEWASCNAELHNLDTLKKHLLRIHGTRNAQELFECWWKGCSVQTGSANTVADTPATFVDMEAWINHVDAEHLQSIAWELGDGPKGDISFPHYYNDHENNDAWSATPSYLSDSQGRSVTPVISPPTISTSAQQSKNTITTGKSTSDASSMPPSAVPQVKRLGRPPKDSTDTAERDEKEPAGQLRKLEAHLRTVGPTMDRMGCVLASEERRKTFLDGEDFEDVVDGSEFDDDEREEAGME